MKNIEYLSIPAQPEAWNGLIRLMMEEKNVEKKDWIEL